MTGSFGQRESNTWRPARFPLSESTSVIAAEVLKEYSRQRPSVVMAPRCRTVGDGLKDVPAERDDFGKTTHRLQLILQSVSPWTVAFLFSEHTDESSILVYSSIPVGPELCGESLFLVDSAMRLTPEFRVGLVPMHSVFVAPELLTERVRQLDFATVNNRGARRD